MNVVSRCRAWFALFVFVLLLTSLGQAKPIRITIIQINDVYEIAAINSGKEGGMARLATLKRELSERNPHTFLLLAGDLFSPSALSAAKVDGQRLNGRQMVDVLNQVDVDLCTFGNHEFDLKRDDFLARLAESRFAWTSTNVFDADGMPFPKVTDQHVIEVGNPHRKGGVVRIGVIGVTVTNFSTDYVHFDDPLTAMQKKARELRPRVDFLIGLTHLDLDDDIALVQQVPELDLVLGGHDHENVYVQRGPGFTPITKADANARSAYVHDIEIDSFTGEVTLTTRLQRIDESLRPDPRVADLVRSWEDRAFAAFEAQGFHPREMVAETLEALDGKESSVRNRSTNLTELVVAAFHAASPEADLALFNSGSIRIDDVVPPGVITQYDVLRMLPFGGSLEEAMIRGDVLQRILDAGVANRGEGGFLQLSGARSSGGTWMIGGAALDPAKTYRVVLPDFLLTGRESGLSFLGPTSDERRSGAIRVQGTVAEDQRQAVIAEFQRRT
ncbi:MAG: bifunctional metallophosphatase/5'-nucleotidase [Planctomycetes bacterium]|nr:bifunctional metallophosphatase/5'-nucleotidase [Planctomycetota bacterium]